MASYRQLVIRVRFFLQKIVYFFTQPQFKKLLIVFVGLSTIIFFGIILLVGFVWAGIFGPLPTTRELRSVANPVATEIYSADSVLLGRYYIQERSDIRYDQIPKHVIHAVVATEDARFYSHHGIDSKGFLRVLFKSILLRQESSGGGSTITQQLAKNLFPRKNYIMLSLFINKIREAIIATRLEKIYDKKKLLTLYLNTVSFGDNTFGLEAAAQRFFSIHASNLTVSEGATLIGMLKATYSYNPRLFPDRSTQRRNVVLKQMEKYGAISKFLFDSIKSLPLQLRYNRITHHSGTAPYFREYVRKELQRWCETHYKANGDPFNLYTDGLKIYTTLDSRLQNYAETAVANQMAIIQKRFNNHWKNTKPWKSHPEILQDAIKKSDRYRRLKAKGLSESDIKKIISTPILMNAFTWRGEKEVKMSPLDSIRYYLTFLNTGVFAIDPTQGAIRVWVGGINHNYFQFDHVKESTKRQVGSTFKPIVYASALEQGMAPCEFTSAQKITYTDVEEWQPENGEENYDLKFSMEGALAYSVNTVSVKVLEKAGIANTIKLAHAMGIKSQIPAVPSLALGVADISMFEMVTAYSCFANDGKTVLPYYLTSITTHDDSLLQSFIPLPSNERVVSSDNAQIMIQMLKRTVREGTGASLRSVFNIQNDMAGKTGTTQSNADGWFMAMTPRLVIGAWVGADDPRIRFRTTSLGQGARTALPIIGNFFQLVNQDNRLRVVSQAQFPSLSSSLESKLSCDLYKSDKTLVERIFGKRRKGEKRNFGQKKKTFFERLFSKE